MTLFSIISSANCLNLAFPFSCNLSEKLTCDDWKKVKVEKVSRAKDQNSSTKVERNYILHKASGDLYLDESKSVIRVKCVCIALASFAYIALRTSFHVSRLILDTAYIAKNFFSEKFKHQQEDKTLAHRHIMQALACAKKNMTFIAKAPLYAVGMQFGSLFGVVHPLLGRRWIAQIESFYHDGCTIKDVSCCVDILQETKESFYDRVYHYITEKKDVFFLANCFQPRGNISSKDIQLLS
jgi:hypothetical protein